jgi:hypothetical protein
MPSSKRIWGTETQTASSGELLAGKKKRDDDGTPECVVGFSLASILFLNRPKTSPVRRTRRPSAVGGGKRQGEEEWMFLYVFAFCCGAEGPDQVGRPRRSWCISSATYWVACHFISVRALVCLSAITTIPPPYCFSGEYPSLCVCI